MEKFVRDDGKVAVIFSEGYGAGWSTWSTRELAFDKRIVEWILENADSVKVKNPDCMIYEFNNIDDIRSFVESLGYYNVYCNGAWSLTIRYLPPGTLVRINEYDGHESVEVFDINDYERL